ncbi:hypothetical protein L1887_45961 [Cichorium endivia]|nr:hypothetical protein L1887_45961 [Cichorium endivia]
MLAGSPRSTEIDFTDAMRIASTTSRIRRSSSYPFLKPSAHGAGIGEARKRPKLSTKRNTGEGGVYLGSNGSGTGGDGACAVDGRTTAVACKHGVVVVSDIVDDAVPGAEPGCAEGRNALLLERVVAIVLGDIGGGAAEQVDVGPEGVAPVSAVLTALRLDGAALVATGVARVGVEVGSHERNILGDPVAEGLLTSGGASRDVAVERASPTVAKGVVAGASSGSVGTCGGKVGHRGRVGEDVACARVGSQHAVLGHHAGATRVGDDKDAVDVGELGPVADVRDDGVVDVEGGARADARGGDGVVAVEPVVGSPSEVLGGLEPLARVAGGVKVGSDDDACIADDVAERGKVVVKVATRTVLYDPDGGGRGGS